jgi:OmpA-OmpF porin, OOP family
MLRTVRACGPAAIAALTLAACAQSGPTWSSYTLGAAGSPPAHQVSCFGLLENTHVCQAQAQRICEGQPVSTLQFLAPSGRLVDGEPDARAIVFQCGAPIAALAPARSTTVASRPPVTSVTVRAAPAPRVRMQALPAQAGPVPLGVQ